MQFLQFAQTKIFSCTKNKDMESTPSVFNDDPLYMRTLVGQMVAVTTVENKVYSGVVYVIDPELKTIVLVTSKDPNTGLDFILDHSIKSLEVISTAVVDQSLLFEDIYKTIELSDELKNKRTRVKEWLRSHHINVQEEGSLLKLNDQATIEAPYGPEQCLCSNTIVLDRIRTIISKMPVS